MVSVNDDSNVGQTKLSRIAAYIEDEAKAELEKLAKARKRTVSNLLAVLIDEAIKQAKDNGEID